MKTMHRLLIAGIAVAVAGLVSGCGEREQVTTYKQGKYQGKPDTKPWENDPGSARYTTSKWNRGDQASWEAALRSRSVAQNEYAKAE